RGPRRARARRKRHALELGVAQVDELGELREFLLLVLGWQRIVADRVEKSRHRSLDVGIGKIAIHLARERTSARADQLELGVDADLFRGAEVLDDELVVARRLLPDEVLVRGERVA